MFWDISAKDLISPVLVFIGLLLNALYFNSRLEKKKGDIAVQTEDRKDTQKNRREGLFRLKNSASIARSAARAILDANEHPNKARVIEALLPSLSHFWTCVKTINTETSNNYLDKEDVHPYIRFKNLLLEYFFMLDNTQLGAQEISYGNLGPSLAKYGALRGNSAAIVEYTYNKIYNAQAYTACTNMPRFGHRQILTPEQITDLVALLLDPQSPVNK